MANRLNTAAARNKPNARSEQTLPIEGYSGDVGGHNTSQDNVPIGLDVVASRSSTPVRVAGLMEIADMIEGHNVMATPTSAADFPSELVEAEIIDANTGRKVVMMLSPGQIAQLKSGALEVISQGEEDDSEQVLTAVSSADDVQVYDQVQELQRGIDGETVKLTSFDPAEKVTQTIHDKVGNIIGVQVVSKLAPKVKTNTTRKQLVHPNQPKKQTLGPLRFGATPTFEVESLGQASDLDMVTSDGAQGGNSDQAVLAEGCSSEINRNTYGTDVDYLLHQDPDEQILDESESDKEQLVFCDGANDEKPKKKKMRLSGPSSAQLRRSLRCAQEQRVRLRNGFNNAL